MQRMSPARFGIPARWPKWPEMKWPEKEIAMKVFPMFVQSNNRHLVAVDRGQEAPQNAGSMQAVRGLASAALVLSRVITAGFVRGMDGFALLARSPSASDKRMVSGVGHENAKIHEGATSSGDAQSRKSRHGHIALVGAGPGARDLLTLRAVARLQEADVVFYDRLVDKDVLDLTRRDAERVFVGKHVGGNMWPQDRINRVIVAEALKGRRVVRLKSGDPGIFGRATEEIEAARAAAIPVEIVPGITAASAAGASLTRSLTERGVANTLVLTTGTGCAKDPLPDSSRLSGPGTTTVFYMSVRQADRLAHQLMKQGLPPQSPVDICVDVSKPGERHVTASVDTMSDRIAEMGITGCAVLLVTWPTQSAPVKEVPRVEYLERSPRFEAPMDA